VIYLNSRRGITHPLESIHEVYSYDDGRGSRVVLALLTSSLLILFFIISLSIAVNGDYIFFLNTLFCILFIAGSFIRIDMKKKGEKIMAISTIPLIMFFIILLIID
jgi:hypothetical protein